MAEPGPDLSSTVLPETAQAVESGRRFAQAALNAGGYRGRHEDILLIVSELVTNVLRHGSGAPRLSVLCSADGARVRVEVADDSPIAPAPRPSGPHGGFGLMVVGRLGEWGTIPRGAGKVVWCEVETADVTDGAGLPTGRAPDPELAVSP